MKVLESYTLADMFYFFVVMTGMFNRHNTLLIEF